MQGQLQVKSPLNPLWSDYYCVLAGSELNYYANAEDAKNKAKMKDKTDAETMLDWDGKTLVSSFENCFLIQSTSGSKYQAQAPDTEQRDQWLNCNVQWTHRTSPSQSPRRKNLKRVSSPRINMIISSTLMVLR